MNQFNVKEFLINHYDILESTQNTVKQLIDSGNIATNTAISANHQTNGKGRYNRTWLSDKGNLTISYCLQNTFSNPELLCYVFVISLHQVLLNLGISNAQLKWVNDILIEDKKISGILLERYHNFLICGVGCNILDSSNDTSLISTSLQSHNIYITNIELITKLSIRLSDNLQHYKSYGFIRFKNYWLKYAYKIDNEVIIKLLTEQKCGIFKTIDDTGKLVLEINGIYHTISSGELFNI